MAERGSATAAGTAYQIRPLVKRDQRVIAGMLGRLADEFDEDAIRDIISSARGAAEGENDAPESDADRQARVIEVFLTLFRRCMSKMTAEAEAWLADLIRVTPEEYQNLPIDIDVQVLTQLKEAPEVERFFTGVSQLFSGTQWLDAASARVKTALGSVIDSLQESSTD